MSNSDETKPNLVKPTDKQAEWVTVALLGTIGVCGIWAIAADFWNFGPDAGMHLSAAVVASVLFAVGVWAAVRIGGVLPVIAVLPLLLLAATPLAFPDNRLVAVERAIANDVLPVISAMQEKQSEFEATLIDANAIAVRANQRLDQIRITYPRDGGEGPLLRSSSSGYDRELVLGPVDIHLYAISVAARYHDAV